MKEKYKVGYLVTYTAYFTQIKPKGDVLTVTGYIEKHKDGIFTVKWFDHPSGYKQSKFLECYMTSLKIVG